MSAFAKIASTVSNWITEAIQVKEVKAMVRKHGDSMDQMLAGMEDVSASMLAILEEDEKKIASYAEMTKAVPLRARTGAASAGQPDRCGRERYEDQREICALRAGRGRAPGGAQQRRNEGGRERRSRRRKPHSPASRSFAPDTRKCARTSIA